MALVMKITNKEGSSFEMDETITKTGYEATQLSITDASGTVLWTGRFDTDKIRTWLSEFLEGWEKRSHHVSSDGFVWIANVQQPMGRLGFEPTTDGGVLWAWSNDEGDFPVRAKLPLTQSDMSKWLDAVVSLTA